MMTKATATTKARATKTAAAKRVPPSPASTLAQVSAELDVRGFIQKNITRYEGDAAFLQGASETTTRLWQICLDLLQKERENGGVLGIDVNTVSLADAFGPGYIDADGAEGEELIVGVQTDYPLRRAVKPFGGARVVQKACAEHGAELDEQIWEIFTKYRKSHNDGVFDVYTDEMRRLRKSGLLTGLPDNYARGRIIGDYRRLALYGVDKLIEVKEAEKAAIDGEMTDEQIRLREEVTEQIKALAAIKTMAANYGFDVSQPAQNAREAIQWTYFAYLAAVKEQDGAAMSFGNVADFFDIYLEREIKAGTLTEQGAQDLIDQFVMKLRLVRHLRMNEYDEIFAGDPTWVTLVLGGMFSDGQHRVTKTDFRILQTLYNLGPAPEPNITILWSDQLPIGFKQFCAQVSIDTSSIQYENDGLMQRANAMVPCCDDYGISCCVSYLAQGKQMQYFGARCNLVKTLLLALNEGRDEKLGMKIVEGIGPVKTDKDGYLDFADVMQKYEVAMQYMAAAYIKTMNVIHYMHDKYYYERVQMAFLDAEIERVMALGAAGLSVAADSLAAIKYAQVKPVRNEAGLTVDFEIRGDYPAYGNDDDRVDVMARDLVKFFSTELGKHHIYRGARPTLSILTITSNVMYGKKTGASPDGRKDGEPFAPGANPMHGRDKNGAVASLNSVAKIAYEDARDGVSNTFSIVPKALGATAAEKVQNLVTMLDGYFTKGAHHLNVNVFDRATLVDAMDHPEKYPQLTIRVSGYAVNFVKLSKAHQLEVLARTFHE